MYPGAAAAAVRQAADQRGAYHRDRAANEKLRLDRPASFRAAGCAGDVENPLRCARDEVQGHAAGGPDRVSVHWGGRGLRALQGLWV